MPQSAHSQKTDEDIRYCTVECESSSAAFLPSGEVATAYLVLTQPAQARHYAAMKKEK